MCFTSVLCYLQVEACIGREVEVGGSYFATVVAIKDFGAFVELEGGLQGMVHISEISHNKVSTTILFVTSLVLNARGRFEEEMSCTRWLASRLNALEM